MDSLSIIKDVLDINTDTDKMIKQVEKNQKLSASATKQTVDELNALRLAQIIFVGAGFLIGAGNFYL